MKKHLSGFYPAGILAVILFVMTAAVSTAAEQNSSSRFGHQAVPHEQLNKEHKLTQKVASVAEETAAGLREDDEISKQRLIDLHDFFVNFVDACHHGKEERYFFPVALTAQPDLAPVIETLRLHHDIGKSLLKGLDRALAIWEQDLEFARREAADNLVAYVGLLRRHIDLESDRLIEPAQAALTDKQLTVIRAGFHYIESEQLGEGFHEKYHAVAMKLLNKKDSQN